MTKCTKAENAVSPTNAKTLPFRYSYSLKDLYQLTCSTDKISLIPRPSSLGTRLTVLVGAAMLLLLRIWVGLVAAIAVVNAVQCFLDGQYPQKMIYTLQPHEGLWWGAWRFQPCPILTPSSYYPHPPTSFPSRPLSYTPLCPNVWSVDTVGCSGARYICSISTQQEVSRSIHPCHVWPNPPPILLLYPPYSLFLVTFSSFLVAFLHFASEIFLYGTADLAAGSILPLIVSGQ